MNSPPGRLDARCRYVIEHGENAGPAEARRGPTWPRRSRAVPLRGQGPAHRRDGATDDHRRGGGRPLRRARRPRLLPAAARVRHVRPARGLVLEGDEAISVVRALTGATDGRKADPGTIRGDLSLSNRENLVHASDSAESAEREIALWFPEL